MDLNQLWFGLIALLFAGFFFLEGFDFGVGMLAPLLGGNDEDRGRILRAIGPHWDANEVWLVTAGGATFAAFPRWYAAMFSGLYPLLLILLLALIVRGTAIEFRGRLPGAGWRGAWSWLIAAGSFVAAMALGAIFGNLVRGIPIDAAGSATGGWGVPFNAYSLVCGAAAVGLCLLHGADFLSLKLAGGLSDRARVYAGRFWWTVLVLVAMVIIFSATNSGFGAAAFILQAAALVCAAAAGILAGRRRAGWGFLLGGLAVLAYAASFFAALYPRVIVSSTAPGNSLTIYDAASSPYTLQVMTIVAAVFVPVVLAYQAWSYWVFRERITAGEAEEY
jgi:cytochrome d ubiquinol oxidase subunit II